MIVVAFFCGVAATFVGLWITGLIISRREAKKFREAEELARTWFCRDNDNNNDRT